jgi:hypothetical protein
MPLTMFDQLVFGSLVLTAFAVSTVAQASPPPDTNGSSGRRWLPPAMRIYTPPPARPAPQPSIGFNPHYRPIIRSEPPK